MWSRALCLLGFLLYSCHAWAQAYEPGLLVRSNGDTLRGEIENSFWVEPPTFIHYRAAADKPAELFLPRQLRMVQFTGGRYFRYEILPLDHGAETRLAYLPRGNKRTIQVDSLLAEVLVEGPATLLRVAWPSANHYIISCPNQPFLELSERSYLHQAPNGAWLVTDGNNYQGQLQVYFGKCPAASSISKTAPFSAMGLVTVVQAYNQACSTTRQLGHSWLAQAKPRRRMAFQGGLLAGIRYNRTESTSIESSNCADCQVHPFAGLYAELLQPSRVAAIYGELGLSRFHSRDRQLYASNSPAHTDFDYRAWLATARLGARFSFPLPHEQQYLVTFSYELNTILSPVIIAANGPLRPVTSQDLFYASPTTLPNLGLGWRNRRITLNLDVQLYQDNSTSGFTSIFFGTNYALRTSVGYRLGSNPDVATSHH